MTGVQTCALPILLLPVTSAGGSVDPAGAVLALVAGACWAAYIVFGQRAGRLHGDSASMWGILVAAAVVVPVGVASAGQTVFTWSVLPMGLAVAVLSSALPYTLEMAALRTLSARAYGTLMSLDPALAALAGLVLLGERIDVLQWLGIGAVMVASIGTMGGESNVQLTDA